jgi:microcystin-dependent protein
MAEFYIGQVVLFAGNFAPVGWVLCDGSLLAIAQYDALYTVLGTTYGGDGQTTFGVPDLRGAVPVSAGQGRNRSNYFLGQTAGSESVTLTSAQMPGHTHTVVPSAAVNVSSQAADQTSASGNFYGKPTAALYNATGAAGNTLNAAVATYTTSLEPAGGGQPLPTMGPYLVMNYCMCTEGIFPTQG